MKRATGQDRILRASQSRARGISRFAVWAQFKLHSKEALRAVRLASLRLRRAAVRAAGKTTQHRDVRVFIEQRVEQHLYFTWHFHLRDGRVDAPLAHREQPSTRFSCNASLRPLAYSRRSRF